MFEKQPEKTSAPSMSSAGASPAKTSHQPGKGRASPEKDPGSGSRCSGSSTRSARGSSSSKTSPPGNDDGCPRCGEGCTCLDTEAVPSHFLPLTSGPRIYGGESSLLPTLMASHPEGLRDRRGRSLLPTLTGKANLLAPSMQKWAAHRRLLPMLSAVDYGSNRGGAAGRIGPVKKSLRGLAGGPLNLRWCEWFMGFPEGWTRLDEKL